MEKSVKYKSWNEFWGEFLQVRFHASNPDLWPSRERKAKWSLRHFDLAAGAKILDLGCGDGLIDIWLSRFGFEVTAVDQCEAVLELAEKADDTNKVQFICSDLKSLHLSEASFDAILWLETSGLMNRAEELQLLKNAYCWLKPGGKLIADCPEMVEETNSWSKEFSEGRVRCNSSFAYHTRMQRIEFFFKPTLDEEFGLRGLAKGEHGLSRYLYTASEMKLIFDSLGFISQAIDHYYPKNYFAFRCERPMT